MKRSFLCMLLLLIATMILTPAALAACSHPANQQECYKSFVNAKYERIDDVWHSVVGDLYEEFHCLKCNTWYWGNLIEKNASGYEMHDMENGACILCERKAPAPVKPSKIILEKSGTVTLNMGNTLTLNYAFQPAEASAAIKWTSSSKKVATVDENGVVTPVKEGTATITVKTANGKKDTVKIKVVDPFKPTKVILDKSGTVTLNMGDTLQLNAALAPETAKTTLKWTSSSKKIATIDENGVVTPVKEGSATITVKTANGKKDTVKVKVVDPFKPSKVILDKSGTVTLNMGDTLQLNAALAPETAKTTLKWTSSSKKIATIDENGVVTPVKEGTATITVKTANGKKDTVKIKVVDPFKPSKVILDKSGTVTLNMGDTLQLNAALAPETAQSKLAWTSSSRKVAAVDENGLVTPVKEGSATITVKTHNGKKDTVKVKVVDPFKATAIKAPAKLTVTEGETFSPEYRLVPETATSTVKASSSSSKILKVNANGTVTALKKGSATLTLKTSSGKSCKIKVTVQANPAAPEKPVYDEMTKAIVDEMRARLNAGQYETALYYMEQYCKDGKWNWISALFNEGLISADFHEYLCSVNSTYANKFGGSKLPEKEEDKDDKPSSAPSMDDLRIMANGGYFANLYDMYKNGVITEEQHLRLMEEYKNYYDFVKAADKDTTPETVTLDYLLELYKCSEYAKMSKLYSEGKIPADVHEEMIRITGDSHYWSPVIPGSPDDKDDDKPGKYTTEELYEMCRIAIAEHAEHGSYETWEQIGNAIVNGDITASQAAILAETYGSLFTDRMDELGVPY